jgi:hypothetical protein
MKNLFLFLFCLTLLVACDNDDDQNSQDPVSQLPEATQTGENTAGCLVNGEVFLPKGGGLAGNKNCFYQYVDGGYNFLMRFSDFSGNDASSVGLGTQNAKIEKGQTYILNARPFFTNNEDGKGGGYSITKNGVQNQYSTTPQVVGEMTITKLDFENNIVSVRFGLMPLMTKEK